MGLGFGKSSDKVIGALKRVFRIEPGHSILKGGQGRRTHWKGAAEYLVCT